MRTDWRGDDVRRNYSICSPARPGLLRVAVKRLPGGAFSTHALDVLRAGDVLDVMTPTGRFFTALDPAHRQALRRDRRRLRDHPGAVDRGHARWRPSRASR